MNKPLEERTVLSSLSGRIARHIADVPGADISPAAIQAAKLFMLDTLAVAWAGSDAPGCREAYGYLMEEGGRADSTAWAYGGKLGAASAAFINGMTAAALDFDSLGRDAPVHVNIAVLPAALAVAERQHVTGSAYSARQRRLRDCSA
jgi:2-methylcitrate dehydratase PrpD